MRKTIISIIFTISVLFNGIYAQTITDVIKSMPSSIVWGLSDEEKEDLTSNPTDTTFSITDNDLYEKIIRKELSNDYIHLQTSKVGSIQIKLLPLINDTKIICVVKTVCKDICDSNITFYTPEWKQIEDQQLYPKPILNWFLKVDTDSQNEELINAIAAIDILPIKYILSSGSNTLKVDLDIQKYLDEKSFEKLVPFLSEKPKELNWNKTSFN